MRVGLTWLSRTSRRGNMPARQGFRPASGVSEAPKTSVQVGTRNRSGSLLRSVATITYRCKFDSLSDGGAAREAVNVPSSRAEAMRRSILSSRR